MSGKLVQKTHLIHCVLFVTCFRQLLGQCPNHLRAPYINIATLSAIHGKPQNPICREGLSSSPCMETQAAAWHSNKLCCIWLWPMAGLPLASKSSLSYGCQSRTCITRVNARQMQGLAVRAAEGFQQSALHPSPQHVDASAEQHACLSGELQCLLVPTRPYIESPKGPIRETIMLVLRHHCNMACAVAHGLQLMSSYTKGSSRCLHAIL